jgi:hypothetical protein
VGRDADTCLFHANCPAQLQPDMKLYTIADLSTV